MIKRLLGIGLALLFALGFGLGGLAGITPLYRTFHALWQTQHWVEVQATVQAVDLKSISGSKGNTFELTASYTYEFNGLRYTGHRVGLYDSQDNIGDWHHRWYQRLLTAQTSGEKVAAWVAPQHPEQALLDREIRWRAVAFHIPFAVLFPLVSVLAIWMLWHLVRPASKPTTTPPWRGPLQSLQGVSAFLFIFGTFFNVLGGSFAFVAIPRSWTPHASWLILIFPLVGTLIWYVALRDWLGRRRVGAVTIHLNNPALHLGGSISGQLNFPKLQQGEKYCLSLLCEHVDGSGEDTSRHTLWSDEQQLVPYGSSVAFNFSLPAQLRPSQPVGPTYDRWLLLLQSDAMPSPFEFELNVLAADIHGHNNAKPETVSTLHAASTQTKGTFSFPPEVCSVEEGPGFLHIAINPKRFHGELGILFGLTLFILLLGALIFATKLKPVGVFVLLLGGAIFYAALLAIKDDLRLCFDEAGLKISRTTLFNTRVTLLNSREIKRLIALPIQTQQTDARVDQLSFELLGQTTDGHVVELFRNVQNNRLIEALMLKMQPFLADAATLADIRDVAANRELIRHNPPRNVSWARKNIQVVFIAVVVAVTIASWASLWMMHDDRAVDRHPIAATADAWFTAMDADRLDDLQAIARLGFNIDTQAENGSSALALASTKGHVAIARWLLDAGADLHQQNGSASNGNYKSTPLMRAGYGANPELVALLLERGARIKDEDAFQRTPLHFMAWGGCGECIRMMVDRGAQLEARASGDRGETPLMSAAGGGHIEAVKTLLTLGADRNAKDDYGYNAQAWAEFHKHPEVIEYLKSLPQ